MIPVYNHLCYLWPSALIRDGKTPQLVSVIQTGMSEGMISMERCIRELVEVGKVRAEDAKAVLEG
ncbi:MAG: hypothetical protein GWP91_19760 [Rhodobacterales bacterium]|nr:hypothetical protein [Rhodobacterales bacterium]